MDKPRLEQFSDIDLRQVKENAMNRGRLDVAKICDDILSERKLSRSTKGALVTEFHFICRKGLNLSHFGGRLFKSGEWAVAEKHWEPAKQNGSLVALHEERSQSSYFQGKIVDYEKVLDVGTQRWKVIFIVDPTCESLLWFGESTGERGYKY